MPLKMIPTTIFTILALSTSTEALKVLVLFTLPSYSHQRPGMGITERLVQEGHEVFAVSPNRVEGLKNNNYTFVNVSFAYDFVSDEEEDDGINFQHQMTKWDLLGQWEPLEAMLKAIFTSEAFLQFQERVRAEKIKFDVVIIETYYPPYLCGIARLLAGSAPVIALSGMVSTFGTEDDLGSIQHPSYVPSYLDAYTDKMNLWQKLDNWYSLKYFTYEYRKQKDEAARKFFRETYGSASESLSDGSWASISLLLIASNPLYFYPRALGPNIIEVGPLHIKPPAKLPKNLQDWLDGAEKGVIYFSLGSNMKSKSLPANARENFLKFFRELPSGYRVLWKWELDGKIPGQSDNILAQKWTPQQSVLAHPKVKVFIMQGGLQSFQETIHFGVPTVGIPWFGDQDCTVSKMVDAEIGVRLLPAELHSFQKIKSALEAVLYDAKYSRNMKRHSAISHDFTSEALDKAVFWVEHVAKHKGASHLRPSTADTTLFEFFCLDILSVILVLLFIVFYIIRSICKFLISIIPQKPTPKIKKTN